MATYAIIIVLILANMMIFLYFYNQNKQYNKMIKYLKPGDPVIMYIDYDRVISVVKKRNDHTVTISNEFGTFHSLINGLYPMIGYDYKS